MIKFLSYNDMVLVDEIREEIILMKKACQGFWNLKDLELGEQK